MRAKHTVPIFHHVMLSWQKFKRKNHEPPSEAPEGLRAEFAISSPTKPPPLSISYLVPHGSSRT